MSASGQYLPSVDERRTTDLHGLNVYTAEVLAAFSALSHPTRLGIFRMLVGREPGGIEIDEIVRAVGGPRSMIARHLLLLSRVRLVRGFRLHDQVIYRARLKGVYGLLQFMVEGCCATSECACLPDDSEDDAVPVNWGVDENGDRNVS